MNNSKRMAALLMATVLTVPQGSGILAQAAEEPETTAAAESLSTATAKKTTGLVHKGGKYYYYSNGTMLKNRWVRVSGKKYYLGADGAAKTGWYTIKERTGYKTYYFNARGVMQAKYTKSADKTLITAADSLIRKLGITYKTGSNTAMLKIYNYMRNSCAYRREEFPTASQKGWDISYAGKMLTVRTDQGKYAGNCYSFAATYAYLVKRVTGLPVRIGMGSTNVFKEKSNETQPHAWCEVQIGKTWYTFDPNLAMAAKNNPQGSKNPAAKGKSFYKQKRSSMVGKLYKGVNGTGNPTYVEVKI